MALCVDDEEDGFNGIGGLLLCISVAEKIAKKARCVCV